MFIDLPILVFLKFYLLKVSLERKNKKDFFLILIKVKQTPSQQTDSPISDLLNEILEVTSITKLPRTYLGLFFKPVINP